MQHEKRVEATDYFSIYNYGEGVYIQSCSGKYLRLKEDGTFGLSPELLPFYSKFHFHGSFAPLRQSIFLILFNLLLLLFFYQNNISMQDFTWMERSIFRLSTTTSFTPKKQCIQNN